MRVQLYETALQFEGRRRYVRREIAARVADITRQANARQQPKGRVKTLRDARVVHPAHPDFAAACPRRLHELDRRHDAAELPDLEDVAPNVTRGQRRAHVVITHDGLVEEDGRLHLVLQASQTIEDADARLRLVVRVERLLDARAPKRIEAAQHRHVRFGVTLVCIQNDRRIGNGRAHRMRPLKVVTWGNLQLDAPITLRKSGLRHPHGLVHGNESDDDSTRRHARLCRGAVEIAPGFLSANKRGQGLLRPLAIEVPQRRFERRHRHTVNGRARQLRERCVDLARMQIDLAQYAGNGIFLQKCQVIGQRFGKIPGACESDILADAAVALGVENLHDQRFARLKRRPRRLHGAHERLGDAIEHNALHVERTLALALQFGAINLADTVARERVHHEKAVGLVDARELPLRLRKNLAGKSAGVSRGHMRISHFDHGDGTTAPGLVLGAIHVGIGHAGNLEQLAADLFGIDVLATRHEHVVGAFLDAERATLHLARVAREKIAVGGDGTLLADIALEHARTTNAQFTAPIVIGIDDAGIVTRQQIEHAAVEFLQRTERHETRGFRHAIAHHDGRLHLARRRESIRIRRSATQKNTLVRLKGPVPAMHALCRPGKQVAQGLVDNRNMRRVKALRVGKHAGRFELAIENERRATQERTNDHLQAANVIKRQADLPQHLVSPGKNAVERPRRAREIPARNASRLRATGCARGEHDDALFLRVAQRRRPLRAVHELAARFHLAGERDHLVHVRFGEHDGRDVREFLNRFEARILARVVEAMIERDQAEAAIPTGQNEVDEGRAVVHVARDVIAAAHSLARHLVHEGDGRQTRMPIGDDAFATAMTAFLRIDIGEAEEDPVAVFARHFVKYSYHFKAPGSCSFFSTRIPPLALFWLTRCRHPVSLAALRPLASAVPCNAQLPITDGTSQRPASNHSRRADLRSRHTRHAYGKRGHLSKLGSRFSLKASRPSIASSVV